jgi:hypothetical protein
MIDSATPLTRFEIPGGALRGTELSLYPGCLVHRGGSHLETLSLAAVAAVRVEFARDSRRLGWGIAWIVVGLVLLAVAPPLGALASAAAQELATQQAPGAGGVAGALLAFFRFVEALARALPLLAAVAALGGALLCVLGWIGSTTLTVSFPGGERAYSVRGRNPLLLAFSERIAEQLMSVKR